MRRDGTTRRVFGVKVAIAPGRPGPPRVGLVVGRDVGSAVRRNRAKRRLREALAFVPLRDGRDYVVIASRAVAAVPFPDLVAWLTRGVDE